MGLAIDTIITRATNPGAGPATFSAVTGDTLVVRNFTPPAYAKLIQMLRRGGTSGFMRVRSPLLHDPSRGIMVTTGQTPSLFALPERASQILQPQDALIVEGSGGAAETDLIALQIYYSDLLGAAARLHMWGDIEPLIKNIKPITVAITTSATIGDWVDTVITTTEDLLHANTDYAVLGYVTNVALGVVAVRGAETGNFRIGGPGATSVEDTSDYFVDQSALHGIPFIPVFNSASRGSFFVSAVDSAASTAATISLICAELSQNLSN